MSREIKFRAWDKTCKIMEMDVHTEYFGSVLDSRSSEVMQFTGLKDKNEKEIYEGDICEAEDNPDIAPYDTGVIEYVRGGFWFKGQIGTFPLGDYGEKKSWGITKEIEVLGNIHENPELLEKK